MNNANTNREKVKLLKQQLKGVGKGRQLLQRREEERGKGQQLMVTMLLPGMRSKGRMLTQRWIGLRTGPVKEMRWVMQDPSSVHPSRASPRTL